ncbi:hypothetical protein [Arcticibacterium luteifluviistationis]|uniref:Phenylalanyl-tRNA synthetase subunit alpha n=1 Tax=Arcticibacterium luteifluviistationis TaxID=1784714 RepID=A0A2Z4G7M5_9BACT|nr:hypothetical protein [Arcticibacterium luteifluviistationis]AWV97174.1 hypothetical protein DJ013_02880 [Arcticibacterium luteifluviistationis]
MKKDIHIPEVKDVFIAVIKEHNEIFLCDDWNTYIFNNKPVDLEMVLIVSHGFDEKDQTTLTRKQIDHLPANSSAKIEMIQPELFRLNNEYKVTFFEENKLKDKVYLFPKDTIKDEALEMVEEYGKAGIIAR